MKVIGLAANRPGAGKDTLAGILREELDPGLVVKREGFADRLKLSAALALGYSPKGEGEVAMADAVGFCNAVKDSGALAVCHEHPTYPEPRITGRLFLQLYGTEAHRDVFSPDFWVDAVLPIDNAETIISGDCRGRDDCDVLVIPDVRFENEAHRVREYGGEVWHVFRPGDTGSDHSAEKGLPDDLIDRHVLNVGTLDELRRIVRWTARDAGLKLAPPAMPCGQS